MTASKENARHALENLKTQESYMNEYAYKIIFELLEAAIKRLPTEESLLRDRDRKKSKRTPPGQSSD